MRALALVLVMATTVLAGEQTLHEGSDTMPVVTLVDADRSDPYEFRYVLVNARGQDWSMVVDRVAGRVFLCTQRYKRQHIKYQDGVPMLSLGGCTQVFEGPVVPKGDR